MIRIDVDQPISFCDGLRRRDFLHIGTLSVLGLSLKDLMALEAGGKERRRRNCIFLFLVGGPSQLDTWDMKPEAPAEVRGPYRPIPTNVDGIQISEIFPRMARQADRFSLVRTVYHSFVNHEVGQQRMQTGRIVQGGLEHPHVGCVTARVQGSTAELPSHVLLPRPIDAGPNLPNGQTAGYLGQGYDPFVLNADPSSPEFQVADLVLPDHVDSFRLRRRRTLRQAIDNAIRNFEESQDARLLDTSFQQAYGLISSAEARQAFDLGREKETVRDRYGRNRFGQGCLLARRLVERGVRFVTVNMFDTVNNQISWDIHGSAPFSPISAYRDLVGPMFDQGYSALIEELHERGLLEDTLVVALGEFGRTPKINPAGGRDHWPGCFSVVFAGGGVRGGQVVGVSDELAGFPKDRPVHTGEVMASIYHSLGVSLETELEGPQGRPIHIVDPGTEPIAELF